MHNTNSTTSSQIRTYNFIHQKIYDFEFLIPISTTAYLGYISTIVYKESEKALGVYGAAAGATLASLDIIAKHFHIYEKSYLTSMALGWSAFNSFKLPFYASDIIGIASGYAFSSVFASYTEHIIAPISGAILGYSYAKTPGAAFGFALGIIDEALSYNNITHIYPFTYALSNIATTNLVTPKLTQITNFILPNKLGFLKTSLLSIVTKITESSYMKDVLAIAYSAYQLNYKQNNSKSDIASIKLARNLYEVNSKIISHDILDDLIERQMLSTIALNLILSKSEANFISSRQDFRKEIMSITTDKDTWNEFFKAFKRMPIVLVPYLKGYFLFNYIDKYFQKKLRHLVSNQLNKQLLDGETLIFLNRNKAESTIKNSTNFINSKVLIDKMNDDITTITSSKLTPEAMNKIIAGIYSTGSLLSHQSLDLILITGAFTKLVGSLVHFISSKATSYDNEIHELSSKIDSKYNYVKEHAELMTLNKANKFNEKGREELMDEVRAISANQGNLESLRSFLPFSLYVINYFINVFLIAEHIHEGTLDQKHRDHIILSMENFYHMISWDASKAGELKSIFESIKRILEIKSRMDQMLEEPSQTVEIIPIQSNETKLCFTNYKVGKLDESRLFIEDLCIKPGFTSIIGKSGAGKTTFYQSLQFKHSDIWSTGNITYYSPSAKQPKFTSSSQHFDFPPENTLLELITLQKGNETEIYREKVISLFKTLKMDQVKEGDKDLISRLDEKEKWIKTLSGGQLKKADIIRNFLLNEEKKDNIILADQPFDHLDPEAVKIITNLFVNLFKNTIFIAIDHGADEKKSFYTHSLYFENGTARLEDNNLAGEIGV